MNLRRNRVEHWYMAMNRTQFCLRFTRCSCARKTWENLEILSCSLPFSSWLLSMSNMRYVSDFHWCPGVIALSLCIVSFQHILLFVRYKLLMIACWSGWLRDVCSCLHFPFHCLGCVFSMVRDYLWDLRKLLLKFLYCLLLGCRLHTGPLPHKVIHLEMKSDWCWVFL